VDLGLDVGTNAEICVNEVTDVIDVVANRK
jgi:hypothetical protein